MPMNGAEDFQFRTHCNGLGDDNVKHEFNVCEYCNGTGKVSGDRLTLKDLPEDCGVCDGTRKEESNG